MVLSERDCLGYNQMCLGFVNVNQTIGWYQEPACLGLC